MTTRVEVDLLPDGSIATTNTLNVTRLRRRSANLTRRSEEPDNLNLSLAVACGLRVRFAVFSAIALAVRTDPAPDAVTRQRSLQEARRITPRCRTTCWRLRIRIRSRGG